MEEEHQLRVSAETQKRFSEAELSFDIDWLFIANDIQTNIASKYSVLCGVSNEEFLTAMRYQPIQDFMPIWRKYNRAGRGLLTIGSVTPDCILWESSLKTFVRFSDLLIPKSNKKQITLVLAGSLS